MSHRRKMGRLYHRHRGNWKLWTPGSVLRQFYRAIWYIPCEETVLSVDDLKEWIDRPD